jgi:predicted CopG family antitoxin
VRKDIYELLRKDRRAGESFTKVISRLLNQHGRLDELLGTWGGTGAASDMRRWRKLRSRGGR